MRKVITGHQRELTEGVCVCVCEHARVHSAVVYLWVGLGWGRASNRVLELLKSVIGVA